MRSDPSLIAGDVSFEEARCAHYACLRRGGGAAHEVEAQLRSAAHARASLKSQLHGATSGQLAQLVSQRPLQATMPALSFVFVGVGSAQQPPQMQPQMQRMAPQPFPPPQSYPPPPPFPPPQQFPQQSFPAPQMQQPPPQPCPVAPVAVQPPLRPAAQAAPLQMGPGDVESAWAAPTFQPGGVPETPPPPHFV